MWEHCPRCASNRVENSFSSRGERFLKGILFCIVGIILPFIVGPFGLLGLIIGGIYLLFSPFKMEQLECKDCKLTWTPTKDKQKII